MALSTFKLKNTTTSALSIADMGLTIAGSGNVDLNKIDLPLISACQDLLNYVSNGTIIVNDGSSDLSASNALLFLNNELAYSSTYAPASHTHTKSQISDFDHNHNSLYYTQTEIDAKLSAIDYAFVTANDANTNVTALELEKLTNASNADALHTHAGSGSGAGTLDSAYGAYGTGRTIAVDYGPVQLNASAGFAPIKLNPINYTPNQWLSGGELCFKDNDLWFYDSTKSKWFSAGIINVPFNVNSSNASGHMYYGVVQNTSESGFSMPWPGTIVGLSANSQNSASTKIEIRISTERQMDAYWNSGSGHSSIYPDLNIDFDTLDEIQIYLSGGGTKPNRPNVTVFVRKRM